MGNYLPLQDLESLSVWKLWTLLVIILITRELFTSRVIWAVILVVIHVCPFGYWTICGLGKTCVQWPLHNGAKKLVFKDNIILCDLCVHCVLLRTIVLLYPYANNSVLEEHLIWKNPQELVHAKYRLKLDFSAFKSKETRVPESLPLICWSHVTGRHPVFLNLTFNVMSWYSLGRPLQVEWRIRCALKNSALQYILSICAILKWSKEVIWYFSGK